MDYAVRTEAARRRMADRRIDLMAVAPGDDLRYLCGYSPHADERPAFSSWMHARPRSSCRA
jgi:hypothetical protein